MPLPGGPPPGADDPIVIGGYGRPLRNTITSSWGVPSWHEAMHGTWTSKEENPQSPRNGHFGTGRMRGGSGYRTVLCRTHPALQRSYRAFWVEHGSWFNSCAFANSIDPDEPQRHGHPSNCARPRDRSISVNPSLGLPRGRVVPPQTHLRSIVAQVELG